MKQIKKVNIENIAKLLQGMDEVKIIGKQGIIVDNIADLGSCNERSIVWVSLKKMGSIDLDKIQAAIVVVGQGFDESPNKQSRQCFIVSKNPRLTFAYVVNSLINTGIDYSIHPTAVIHPEAMIAANVSIGPYTVIGKCVINEYTKIASHCYIHDDVIIGRNVSILSSTIIGGVGFGYEQADNKEWILFPHIGGVVIEDNVDIGGNTCIDRGALGNTILKKGCKIDNLVHIAHNVVVGENSLVIAHAMVAGSVKIGINSWIAPGAQIKNGLEIGKNTFVGLGAVVIRSIPDGETWIGNPAKPLIKK